MWKKNGPRGKIPPDLPRGRGASGVVFPPAGCVWCGEKGQRRRCRRQVSAKPTSSEPAVPGSGTTAISSGLRASAK